MVTWRVSDAAAIEGRLYLGKDFGHDRPGKINAAQFGAKHGMKRGELDRHGTTPGKHLPVI